MIIVQYMEECHFYYIYWMSMGQIGVQLVLLMGLLVCSQQQIRSFTLDRCDRDVEQTYGACNFGFRLTYNCMNKYFVYCNYRNLSPEDNNSKTAVSQNISSLAVCQRYCCSEIEHLNKQLFRQLRCKSASSINTNYMNFDYLKFIIVGITFFTFILIAIVIYRCCKHTNLINHISTRIAKQKIMAKEAIIKQWKLTTNVALGQQIKLNVESCSICLSQRSNCVLKCKHSFHKGCIVEWMKMNLQCPLCRSNDLSEMAVLCQECGARQYVCLIGQVECSMESRDICNDCQLTRNRNE